MMKVSDPMNDIHNKFVDDYEKINIYMNNINVVLDEMGLSKFDSYNEFCSDISRSAKNYIKSNKISRIDNKSFSLFLNLSIRDKIRRNKNYENIIMDYFKEKEILNHIKNENRTT